jgi:hypothetical protein
MPVLGASVLELRRLADLDHAPTQFWFEAWASEMLLHLRTQRPQRACAPFWPAAAAAAWPHLKALGEIARLLEHESVVAGVGDLGPASWMPLGAGAPRLARRHARWIRKEYP